MKVDCLDIIDFVVLGVGGFLIGVMRAGFGGGIGVVAVPVLALAVPAKSALGLVLPLSLATDVISARYYWGHWVGDHVKALMPGMVLGILIGAGILDIVPEVWFRRMLGALACIFAVLQTMRDRVLVNVKPPGPWMRFGVGVTLGAVSTLVSAGGVILMLYLLPQGLIGRTFVGTAWIFGIALNLLKLTPYVFLGLINFQSLVMDVWMLPALFLGAAVGLFLNRRLSPVWFNRSVLVLVLGIGLKLMLS